MLNFPVTGHSWANGITNPIFHNIMNQESTSEAIASYEAVALFGKVMASVFRKNGNTDKASKAEMLQNVGRTLTATEVRSTQKYWHVRHTDDESYRIYPAEYKANVVGILWSTFVQFGTWFGSSPYLIYGASSLDVFGSMGLLHVLMVVVISSLWFIRYPITALNTYFRSQG
jgi:endo-1,3(4)-beta-glucanase